MQSQIFDLDEQRPANGHLPEINDGQQKPSDNSEDFQSQLMTTAAGEGFMDIDVVVVVEEVRLEHVLLVKFHMLRSWQ